MACPRCDGETPDRRWCIDCERAYDTWSRRHASDILGPVHQSIWTSNFGSTRFLYDLTFHEGKLIDITTGDYGH